MKDYSFLSADAVEYMDALYQDYLERKNGGAAQNHNTNDGSFSEDWLQFFSSLNQATLGESETKAGNIPNISTELQDKQAAVFQLINAHRFRGHRRANLDPLDQHPRPAVPELDLDFYGLSDDDLGLSFHTGSLVADKQLSLREILSIIKNTYCRSIGFEYMHINSTEEKRWIQNQIEPIQAQSELGLDRKKIVLKRLIAANGIERYLHNRYVGQKRFSLEGGESLIPLMYRLIRKSAEHGVKEVVIGMAHRGRLNVLVNVIGKKPHELFDAFEGKLVYGSSGDVKYHLGHSADMKIGNHTVHVTLAFNPSHLEIVHPVVEGSVRARQEHRDDKTRSQVLPIVMHGDASFAGQGVVPETLNLSQTRGYSTGGTIHIVVNNQIGFTTSDPLDSRSTLYATDVAKMVQAPIFHVNGDDPEAVLFLTDLAVRYRNKYHKDIVIDLICYRRHGHSESDEPYATQPLMYQKIRQHKDVCTLYAERLIAEGVLSPEQFAEAKQVYLKSLEANLNTADTDFTSPDKDFAINFDRYKGTKWRATVDTAISNKQVAELSHSICSVPQNFTLHRSVQKIMDSRRKMADGKIPMDWGYAESMAYASLLAQGFPIRISGQDSARGTFFHRHAVLHDQKSGDTYLPLQNLSKGQPQFLAINSTLSEAAVLGFEYGYSSSSPKTLVIWEAQFGDFANNAQVIFDQFLSSCEAKWARLCGLVVFLPHGYDGQGPEHSSARLERYLQLCAEDNMQVCFPTSAAQIFHLLRLQMLRDYRKPLIVMSPKSLLRHPLSGSSIEELSHGMFKPVIDDIDDLDTSKVKRLIFCSGKLHYEILGDRRKREIDHVAIVRIEQLYPYPDHEVLSILDKYPHVKDVVWAQEEPRNQGSWHYIKSSNRLAGQLQNRGLPLHYIGRFASASPAAGSLQKHMQEQQRIVDEVLALDSEASSKT